MEEIKKIASEINEKHEEITKAVEAKATNESVEALKSELEGLVSEKKELEAKHETLQKQIDDQNIEMQGIRKELTIDLASKKSVKEQIHAELTAKADEVSRLKGGERLQFSFNIKSAGTMSLSGNVVSGDVPQAQREAGLNIVPVRNPFILDLIQRGSTDSNKIEWVYQLNKDGGAGGTAEGAAKNQADFDITVASVSVKKRTVYIKATEEMLTDTSYMASEINNELIRLLTLDVDNQILSGDNSGQNLNGIVTQATAFSAGNFANAVDDPNRQDVLRIAINQVHKAFFQPTSIVLNPDDATLMELEKGSDGHYQLPPFMGADGMSIKGVPVTINTNLTAGKFLVMDGTRATAFFKDDVRIEVGWENDDFTKNLRTILAEARLALRIKTNDLGGFVYGTFSTAITAIDSGS